MVKTNKGFSNPRTRNKTGKQSRHNGAKPISFCATLGKCQLGRRYFNTQSITNNAKKIKHTTASKLRRQLLAGGIWI